MWEEKWGVSTGEVGEVEGEGCEVWIQGVPGGGNSHCVYQAWPYFQETRHCTRGLYANDAWATLILFGSVV